VRYSEAQSTQFFQEVADRARAMPGVVGVTMASSVPMANDGVGVEPVVPEGFQFPAGKQNAAVLASRVDEHYFDVMGLTILRGRGFTADDTADKPNVAVVNEPFAEHYWPNEDPIGKRFRLVRDGAWVQVVGLAKTSKYLFIAEPPTEFLYFPYRQRRPDVMVMLVQTAGDPAGLAGPMREIVHRLDGTLPIYNVRTMEEFYRMRATSIFNVLITTVGAMGLMGLGLAIVGLYGLVAYAVSRRTREIGIRMAIGADPAAVLRMVLRHGLVLASVGLAVGLVASVGAGQALAAAFPSGDDRRDLGALAIVVPIVLAVTFLATYVPARRAAHTNPVLALRQE
jgi:predicted permease